MGRTAPEGCLAAPDGWNGRALDSQRLILRAPKPGDIPRFVELLADPEVARHTAQIPHPYTVADGERFVAAAAREQARREGVTLALEDRARGAVIGCVGARFRDRTAELGYWLGRDYWRQGYGAEAARRCLRLLFQQCNRGLVWAAASDANPASARILAKLGFAHDRRERYPFPARGEEREVEILAIDRERWEALHRKRPRVMAVAAALIDEDGRVLLTERPPGKSMAGLWEFPGGKLEPGETPEAALVRELDEELGIDVTESCLAPVAFVSHDYDTFHLTMPLYACRQWRGMVEPREGQKLAWVRPARMDAYPVPPADLPLVASLRDLV